MILNAASRASPAVRGGLWSLAAQSNLCVKHTCLQVVMIYLRFRFRHPMICRKLTHFCLKFFVRLLSRFKVNFSSIFRLKMNSQNKNNVPFLERFSHDHVSFFLLSLLTD